MLDENRFEIRKGIANHERHNAILQAAYDTVDRMATVFGGITFGELFTQPFDELVPRIVPSIHTAVRYGLIAEPDEVISLLNRLLTAHAAESFRSMAVTMSEEGVRLSREFYSPIHKLWFHQGIRLPELSRDYEGNALVLRRMNDVIEHAGDLGYDTMFAIPRSKELKTATMALRAASDVFIVYLPPANGKCCSCSNGCQCVPGKSSDWCAQQSPTTCASGSTTCSTTEPPTTDENPTTSD